MGGNIAGARAVVEEMGNHFGYDEMSEISNEAAAEICHFVADLIKYHDGVQAGASRKSKDVLKRKMLEGIDKLSKKELAQFRLDTTPEKFTPPFHAAMHLLAGLDIASGVEADEAGKPKDPAW